MPDAKRTSPADPQVLAFFQQELARTAALPGLTAAGPALWPRFAGYYQGLARLPRKVRRALQRRWRRSLGGIALLCALGQAPAMAATISVGGGCTLVDAITAANNDAPTGGCAAGSGADTIALPPRSTHTLTAVNDSTYGFTGLPVISSVITIDGLQSTIARDNTAPLFGILAVGATGNLILQQTLISGGAGVNGGGIYNRGTLTLDSSAVSGNTGNYGGGIHNTGTLTLDSSALDPSAVSGNTALRGGGISNRGTLTLTNSTVSGNSSNRLGGGIDNFGTLTLTNSTLSGNSAAENGGGLYNTGTLTLTNSTISGNASGRVGGGLFNTGTATLVQSLLSGNTAPVIAPEAYNASGTVIDDGFNLFGHDGFSGVAGFTLGATDLVPAVPLPAVLDPTLGFNGGPTLTHVLVFGSPAVDAVPGAGCATGIDQRGAPRPQEAIRSRIATSVPSSGA